MALLGIFQLVAAKAPSAAPHRLHPGRAARDVGAAGPIHAVPADLPPAHVGPPLAAVPGSKKRGSGGGPPPATGPESDAAISALAHDGIPTVALAAYKHAASLADFARPSCHLSWTLLAGIGRVESDHGRFAGAQLLGNGTSSVRIIGIPLNGHGTALIRDTDNGRLDGDPIYDRAVGPMQFIPSTWARYGVDGDGDGVTNPFDVNDAALAAADYLCATGADLATRTGQITAVLTYNHSAAYVAEVLALATAYANGTAPVTVPVTAPPILANPALPTQKAPTRAGGHPGRTSTTASTQGGFTSGTGASTTGNATTFVPGERPPTSSSTTSGLSAPSTPTSPATRSPTSSASAPSGGHSTSTKPSKTTPPPCTGPSSSTSATPSDSSSPSTGPSTASASPSSSDASTSASATPSDSCSESSSPSPSPASTAASMGIASLAVVALFGWALLGIAGRRRRLSHGCHESTGE